MARHGFSKRAKVKGRKMLSGDNGGDLGEPVGLDETSEGGTDAEKHNYPGGPAKYKHGVFAVNENRGAGQKNTGKLPKGKVKKLPASGLRARG